MSMYDPLNEGGFGADDLSPGWPSGPRPSTDTIPNMPRSSRPTTPLDNAPRTPSAMSANDLRGPAFPQPGREPQIYGQPESGLLSPTVTTAANGTRFEKQSPYLRIRLTGLERNRRDVLIRFDAQTNLSNFTGPTYRNVQRSYVEFQQLAEALAHSCPQTITPALPFAQTSAPTDEEDDRLVKIMLQRWVTRISDDPILLHDEELRAFVESDFGYQPTPRPKRKTGSGFSLIRRGVPDEDEELQKARFELTKLETQFFDAAKAVDKLTRTRKALAVTHSEMGNKLVNVATTEAHGHLANAMRKIGRTWHSIADLDQAQALSECVILGDSLGYQGLNSRAAKETLQQRTGVLEEYQQAVKSAISKRRNIERLKASGNIRPERVDEALEEMEEANKYEQVLHQRADGISQNLHRSLATHRQLVTDDITAALIEHVRSSVMYEKQMLRDLEALRPDVDNAASTAPLPTAVNAPARPSVIPKLEDYNPNRIRAPPPAPLNGAHAGFPQRPLSAAAQAPLPPTPASGSSNVSSAHHSPVNASFPASSGPPLGGRYVEGTQSMFITPSPRSPVPSAHTSRTSTLPPQSPAPLPSAPSTPSAIPPSGKPPLDPLGAPAGASGDPLLSGTYRPAGQASPSGLGSQMASPVDPLGGLHASTMSASMSGSVRMSHGRSRLDAREAASKLANAF